MRLLLLPIIILLINTSLIGIMTFATIHDPELPLVGKLLLDVWFFGNAASFVICWRYLNGPPRV